MYAFLCLWSYFPSLLSELDDRDIGLWGTHENRYTPRGIIVHEEVWVTIPKVYVVQSLPDMFMAYELYIPIFPLICPDRFVGQICTCAKYYIYKSLVFTFKFTVLNYPRLSRYIMHMHCVFTYNACIMHCGMGKYDPTIVLYVTKQATVWL